MRTCRLPVIAGLLLAALVLARAEDEKPKEGQKECNKDNCPWPIWNHYEAKGCKPIYDKDSCCPTSFNCTEYEKTGPEAGCKFKGHTYKQGEVINTTNPCHTCKCGANGVAGCAVIECFSEISQPRCIPQFEHNECCPSNYYCMPLGRQSLDEIDDMPTCKWEGKTYVKGQIIEIKDKPCLTCICETGFKGPESPSCKKVECSFPGNNLKMHRGCVPVYLESRCCSIDWICPPPEEPKQEEATPAPGSCKFGNRFIPPGGELELQDPCTSCKCTTAPDLTCIRQQCKGPPDNDFLRCHPFPKEGQCCPEFKCGMGPPMGGVPFGGPGGPFQGPPHPEAQQESQKPSQ